jgi:hypothetical protein
MALTAEQQQEWDSLSPILIEPAEGQTWDQACGVAAWSFQYVCMLEGLPIPSREDVLAEIDKLGECNEDAPGSPPRAPHPKPGGDSHRGVAAEDKVRKISRWIDMRNNDEDQLRRAIALVENDPDLSETDKDFLIGRCETYLGDLGKGPPDV